MWKELHLLEREREREGGKENTLIAKQHHRPCKSGRAGAAPMGLLSASRAFVLAVFILLQAENTYAENVTTISGRGSSGKTDGSSTRATFNVPLYVASASTPSGAYILPVSYTHLTLPTILLV